jgi:hypothetical protein
MTEDQFKQIMEAIRAVGGVAWAVLIVQAIIGIALVMAHRKIARNQVTTAELLAQAVAKIEHDLPAKK